MQKANQLTLTGLSNQLMKEHRMANQNFTLTQELLHELFEYKDGNLYSKKNKANNKIKIGDKIGTKNGNYFKTSIYYKEYLLHRLIFMYVHGYLPKYIDHINNDPTDNRIENLRSCTNQQNSFNATKSKNNSTGVKGVSWDAQRCKWSARIQINGKTIHLGRHKTIDEAEKAVKSAREQLHGSFARHI